MPATEAGRPYDEDHKWKQQRRHDTGALRKDKLLMRERHASRHARFLNEME